MQIWQKISVLGLALVYESVNIKWVQRLIDLNASNNFHENTLGITAVSCALQSSSSSVVIHAHIGKQVVLAAVEDDCCVKEQHEKNLCVNNVLEALYSLSCLLQSSVCSIWVLKFLSSFHDSVIQK